jgi:hypothetical protein
MAKQDHTRTGRVIALIQKPAQRRVDFERVEKVAGDDGGAADREAPSDSL